MSAVVTDTLGRVVPVEELQERVSQLSLKEGVIFTAEQCLRLIIGPNRETVANPVNLPLLAKAFILWGRVDSDEQIESDEFDWLLRACNSLPWYSRLAAQIDTADSVIGMIIRQAFIRYATDDPIDARIARTWIMFHDLVGEGTLDVPDPSTELRKTIGVSAEELWTVGYMVWAHCFCQAASEKHRYFMDSTRFVTEGPNRDHINATMRTVLSTVSASPEDIRAKYRAEGSKYRDSAAREGYWISEFNILRDYPIIALGDNHYCAPYPTYALTRAIDGFYFDLVDDFANRKLADGKGGNPYDNAMTTTLGTLFQRYVGYHLKLLQDSHDGVLSEFKYGSKKQLKDSPDWIVARRNRVPVLIECKAREPRLDVQRYASVDELRTEIRAALGKACGQLARFVQNVDRKEPGLECFSAQKTFICAVVLQTPLPFHMIPDIRQLIENVAAEAEPAWTAVRDRLLFVPMSVRELETAVATELLFDVPIEEQLTRYAEYRDQAQRVERWEGDVPVFPRHLEEYLQEQFNDGNRIENARCREIWENFCDLCHQKVFGETIEEAKQALLNKGRNLSTGDS